jgi:hypothetical protein
LEKWGPEKKICNQGAEGQAPKGCCIKLRNYIKGVPQKNNPNQNIGGIFNKVGYHKWNLTGRMRKIKN